MTPVARRSSASNSASCGGSRGKAAVLAGVLQARTDRPRPHIHPHQAWRGQGGARSRQSRHRGGGDPRQQVAEPARTCTRRVSQGGCAHARGHRHCRPRDRCRRHQPRRELRSSERAGNLCPPHRPHRARRRGRHRDLVLRSRGGSVPARHRKADPPVDPGDRPSRRAAGSPAAAQSPAAAACPRAPGKPQRGAAGRRRPASRIAQQTGSRIAQQARSAPRGSRRSVSASHTSGRSDPHRMGQGNSKG